MDIPETRRIEAPFPVVLQEGVPGSARPAGIADLSALALP